MVHADNGIVFAARGFMKQAVGRQWSENRKPFALGRLNCRDNDPSFLVAEDAFLDLLAGLREGSGLDTPPLSPKTGGPFRIRETLTGVGRREP